MRYSVSQVVFQEIPVEISLAFHITGCPLRCPGCHSSADWNGGRGTLLDLSQLEKKIREYQNYITCVLYLGGEWCGEELIEQLALIQSEGLRTALYTGLELEDLPDELLQKLTYVKVGPYIKERGPLNSATTNQKLIDLRTSQLLNHLFLKEDYKNDSFKRSAN